jgi:DNA-binding winged helix-turn-helix (wHTH) protein/tetratricopeptide (TPR) repeat protein
VSSSESSPIRFRFGAFELDPSAGELRKSGVKIKLQGQPIEILALLLARPGTVVTRQELQRKLWPDNTFVDFENSLNAAVRRLRAALDDSVEKPRFVETLARRGYRFIAAVHPAEPAQAKSVVQSLAGLPLANLSTSSTAERTSFALRPHPPFVGRASEWSELCGALAEAASGRGRLCLISGEPGIGKTRLCTELAAEAQARGVAVLIGRCAEQEAVSYLPFVEILEGLVANVASSERLRKIVGDEGPELADLLPKLRCILPDLPPPLKLSPVQARRNLFNAVVDFITRATDRLATLLILEDLHWANESTLSLLEHLVRRLPDLPALVLGTYRDAESDVTEALLKTVEESIRTRRSSSIRLLGLPREEVALLLRALSGRDAPLSVVNEIYAETSGNPFFVEELLRYLREEKRLFDSHENFRTDLKIGELEVPRNVRVVVGRRLGRLGVMTRKILEAAATIGRSFPFDLLEAATAAAPDPLLDCLDEAEHAALIASSESEARFEFSHELGRQVVLSRLSGARRERLHLDVANAIERVYPNAVEDHYSELAQHYSRANDAVRATEYLARAGQRAAERYAYGQAIENFSDALKHMARIPESTARDIQELSIQMNLCRSVMIRRGQAAPELEPILSRARQLCERTKDPAQLFALLGSLQTFFYQGLKLRKSLEVAEQMAMLVEQAPSCGPEGDPHARLGWTLFWLGDPVRAWEHLAKAATLKISPDRHLVALNAGAWALAVLGRADEALELNQTAIVFAHSQSNPFLIAGAFMRGGELFRFLNDAERGIEYAEQGIAIASEHEFPLFLGLIYALRGWARSLQNQLADGVEDLLRGVNLIETTGAAALTWHRTALAEAYLKNGQQSEARAILREARLRMTATGERLFEPDLLRLEGEFLLSSNVAESEISYRQAIDCARRQGSRLFELRATTSLARMLAKSGKRDEARAMLANIYGQFTEGFDTADLKDAKALLDDLNA